MLEILKEEGGPSGPLSSFFKEALIRPCLKIGGMPDWGRFYCQARRFDAGILTDFKSNQRSPGGKRCPKTAFCHFSNEA
nr:hypothetical protein [uncultured Oscillibacter sp.]